MITEDDELIASLRDAVDSVTADGLTADFAANMGLETGVTGYIYHTVPIVVHAWLSNPCDYRAAVTSVIECGGDADRKVSLLRFP